MPNLREIRLLQAGTIRRLSSILFLPMLIIIKRRTKPVQTDVHAWFPGAGGLASLLVPTRQKLSDKEDDPEEQV